MTAPTREKRTQSFDQPHDGPAFSDYAAARTPLIAGIDYQFPESPGDPASTDEARAGAYALEKPRVDTLSPLESVPPPAPYPSEPPPARPSVVPPVRLAYAEQQQSYARGESNANGIHSEPPLRNAKSDRPSRRESGSDPPPRWSRSDPPAPSSRRGTNAHRHSWDDSEGGPTAALADSLEARRREAETIPADAHSPAQPLAYDPSMPLPALRAASFPASQLPSSLRQHENSRLRHVAMAMMFVIFIVTGAIAGMRWYVAREDEGPSKQSVANTREPRTPRVRLDRLEPNAVVAPRGPAGKSGTGTSRDVVSSSDPPYHAGDPVARAATPAAATATTTAAKPASSHNRRPSKSGVRDPSKVDTKTPLIMD